MKECSRCRTCLDDTVDRCPKDGARLRVVLPGSPVIDRKYQMERRLGHGGMGVVYLVRHLGLERRFALKLIDRPEAGGKSFLEHFQTEAKALGRLKHPNIVEVTDYGVDPRGRGIPYLVMEYLEGQTLHDVCRKEGFLEVQRALPILDAISRAIDYAHQRGVLHRDLKAGNVFLSRSETGAEKPTILDFGLAQLVLGREHRPIPSAEGSFENTAQGQLARQRPGTEQDLEETLDLLPGSELPTSPPVGALAAERAAAGGAIEGTPAYLAPEVLRGKKPSAAADIYAFGILTYEILVGRLPFTGSAFEIVEGHLRSSPPAPTTLQTRLPPELDAPLLAPLSKKPEQRPGQASDVVDALRAAWQLGRLRKWRAHEIPRRLVWAGLLAAILTILFWPLTHLRFVQELEARTVDARFASMSSRLPDPRILVVLVDDASLAADPTPMAEMADTITPELEQIFAAGARGIAIDFILPAQWSHSEKFSRLVLGHSEILTLAAFSSSSRETLGSECISKVTAAALGPSRFSGLFGFANLDEASDGVTRQARLFFRDNKGSLVNSLAGKAASSVPGRGLSPTHPGQSPDQFWIDYTVDPQGLAKMSWKDVAPQLGHTPSLFRGKVVLIGGEFAASGDDYHRVPHRRDRPEAVSGVALQALILNTILEDFPVRTAVVLPTLIVLVSCTALLCSVLCWQRLGVSLWLFVAVAVLHSFLAFSLFWWHLILPLVGPLLTGTLATGAGLMLRFLLPPFPQQTKEAL
jgi:serine/threonine protein kinase/CHASE2 domain-containing sensor protein